MPDGTGPVPWRTIWATIFAVLLTGAGILFVLQLGRVIAWLIVALFFATVLTPAIDILQHRVRMRRGLAAFLVFLAGFGMLVGLVYAFVRPIIDQGQKFLDALPTYVEDAKEGRGPVGDIVQRYDLQKWVEDNQETLKKDLSKAGTPAIGAVRKAFSTAVAGITILVLTFLILMEGPKLSAGALNLVPDDHRERVRRVAGDSARAVSGYMLGNLLISVIAGLATYAFLRIAHVPYPEVLALWVAFADMIPLVGATLGAVPTIGVAFLHSTTAGIAAIVFYVAYQQFENHVLQVAIMSRTVQVNPLGVLISVIAGVELFGLAGALLAIPAAGVIQVVVRDLYNARRGEPKAEPTVGTDEVPLSQADEGLV
jgi:predicted PurR-regulated permease PerM